MYCKTLTAVVYLASLIGAACASAQALAGTYTCANGNPGGVFDYADIGDFFNDLENFGVSGHVVLELYDDGGDFTSKESYQLGLDGSAPMFPIFRPVAGISAANTLTIRAGPGEFPKISGGGATSIFPSAGPLMRGAMSLTNIANSSIEGIEFAGGDFGVMWYTASPSQSDSLRICRCRIHGIIGGSAIGVYSHLEPMHNIEIANNLLWDCNGVPRCFPWNWLTAV